MIRKSGSQEPLVRPSILKWLLDSDPAIRWQVMRDITREPESAIAAERARIATEGWGARIIALQSPEGHWGGNEDKRHWMGTTDILVHLKDLGIDPSSKEARSVIKLVQDNITWWQLDGRPYFDGETEPCINGRILAVGAYFGVACARLVERLLGEQLEDGGWNCEAPQSRRSSFHTTICVLEGLLAYERAYGASPNTAAARMRGEQYLLNRGMLKSLTSGKIIDSKWTRFSFPPIWHYDVLRGMDYLRSAGIVADKRVDEAAALIASRQHQNGRWPRQNIHPERISFEMEGKSGTASRWNTLRALRVLDWYGKKD